MPRTFWITPSLFLGDDVPHLSKIVRVETTEQALAAIDQRMTALLPDGAWDVARTVLKAVGLSDDEVDDRIYFAVTGMIKPVGLNDITGERLAALLNEHP